MRRLSNMLVTGGAGFIGANFIRYLFKETAFSGRIINVDKLTYAGNLKNLVDINEEFGGSRYFFERVDICDSQRVIEVYKKYAVDTVVHFAAESHVDRSIDGPADFIQTNIVGTFTLLEAAKDIWAGSNDVLFHHVSTDEVYGSLGAVDASSHEGSRYDPRSPYSASKASSDHIVSAYFHTYGLPVTLSSCSNNYGPFQHHEKFIPLMIRNIRDGKPLRVYGDGKNVRDWLYVDDHCAALWLILNKGATASRYNVGGENEWENLSLLHVLCEKLASRYGVEKDHFKKLIKFVKDRPGHDRRYALDCSKIKTELGWKRRFSFDEGLDRTIAWSLES